jgi:hypothetical protein
LKITVTMDELASIMDKSRNSIRVYLQRHPERLPPAFKIKGTATPLWLREVVVDFIMKNAEECGATLPKDQSAEPGSAPQEKVHQSPDSTSKRAPRAKRPAR